METIRRLDFDGLTPDHLALYEALTKKAPLSNTLFFVMEESGLLGMAALSLHTHNKIAELSLFHIQDPHLFLERGRKLLHFIEETLAQSGVLLLSALFPEHAPLKELLQEEGWSSPSLSLIGMTFNPMTFNPSWLQKEYPLPEGASLFPWQELTEEERKMLLHQLKQGRFHESVFPLKKENDIQYLNSIGLRINGEVQGWMVCHTFKDTPHTIHYSCLYVDRDLHFKGVSIRLLQEAILTQIAHCPPYTLAYCEANPELTDPNWMRFLKRRLIPSSTSVTKTLQSVKTFQD